MKRHRRKTKKYWIIASVSTLSVAIVGGLVAFGLSQTQPSSNEPKKLEKPTNLEYTINLTETKKTEYLLSWSFVKNATGYKISVGKPNEKPTTESVDEYTNEYDMEDLLVVGEEYEVKLVAIGDEEDYLNSKSAKITLKAEEVTKGLSYEKIKDGYEVSRGEAGYSSRIVIPDSYDGFPITKIADNAFGALMSGDSLMESVRLPSKLQETGEFAFANCSSLKEVNLPETAVTLGEQTFRECTALESVRLPSELKILPMNFFLGCSLLGNVVVPEKIERIEKGVFTSCKKLDSIELPNTLTYIGANAFENTGLTKITIPDSVKHIGNCAFRQMLLIGESAKGIETIEYSPNFQLDYMGKDVFWGTKWYKNQPSGFICFNDMLYRYKEPETDENIVIETYPEGITKMADGVFENCDKIVSVVLPDWIEAVCEYTFSNCSSLKTVQIPNGVKKIDEQAFKECVALENIQFSSGLKEIGVNAFSDCESLEEVNLPNGLEKIGEYAFRGCKSLTNIEIPESVVSIEAAAFFTCANLTSVTLKNPSGWWYADYSDAPAGTSISSEDLSNVSTAAIYLKDTYVGYYWKRS